MRLKEMLKNNNYYPVPLRVCFTNNKHALAYIEEFGREFIDGKIPVRKFEFMKFWRRLHRQVKRIFVSTACFYFKSTAVHLKAPLII